MLIEDKRWDSVRPTGPPPIMQIFIWIIKFLILDLVHVAEELREDWG